MHYCLVLRRTILTTSDNALSQCAKSHGHLRDLVQGADAISIRWCEGLAWRFVPLDHVRRSYRGALQLKVPEPEYIEILNPLAHNNERDLAL